MLPALSSGDILDFIVLLYEALYIFKPLVFGIYDRFRADWRLVCGDRQICIYAVCARNDRYAVDRWIRHHLRFAGHRI
ncbi:hypothetical protein D3C77_524430 [compost metagenome]